MADERGPKPDRERDELHDSDDLMELARFERSGEVRVYKLRPVENGAEFWRFTDSQGERVGSIKETTFRDAGEALEFLEELNRTLKAGGWVAV